MTPEQYNSISTTLATLVAGQGATNEHLRTLNGKVADHEKSLTTLLLWRAEFKGFTGAINMGWTTIVTLVASLFSGIAVYWLFKK